jgi:hypothetical protein
MPSFSGTFLEDHLVRVGASSPVDVSWVVAVSHWSDPDDFITVATRLCTFGARAADGADHSQSNWVNGWIGHERIGGANLSRLLEEAEWKSGGHAKSEMMVHSASCWSATVGGDLGGLGADLQVEAALVGRLSSPKILDLYGIRGSELLLVEDFDLDDVGTFDLRATGKATRNAQVTKAHFTENSRDYDEREKKPQKQVE